MKKINANKNTIRQVCFTVNVVVNIWFSRLSTKTLVLYIRQRILYQIQAYIGRLVLLLTNQKIWANYIFCGKLTIYYFHIFEKYGNNGTVKMTTIIKCFMFRKYSSCVGKAWGCCMHVFLVFK